MTFNYSEADGLSVFSGVRDREAVRKVVDLPYRVFPKTEFSDNSTDVFGGAALKVWYDANDKISGAQIYYPEASFCLLGKQLLGKSVKDLELLLSEMGLELVFDIDGAGFNIKNDTVRFYVPALAELDKRARVEAVYVEIPEAKGESAH
jgi:hypothetical protein